MLVNGKWHQTIWEDPAHAKAVMIIDQRILPHSFTTKKLSTVQEFYSAIHDMWVRGAPLIGVTAAYGAWIATLEAERQNNPMDFFMQQVAYLKESRPTAVNLFYALDRVAKQVQKHPQAMQQTALTEARKLREEEIARSKAIGEHGCKLFCDLYEKNKTKQPLQILTHCNAGWLACVDYGTATAPIYEAFQQGMDLHVWVDETRPRNQGASLTAWELQQMGIPHTVIADNTGGLLMQNSMVDAVIVGSDRTTANGDVANKIGTYLKALAAHDNLIPFWVALPTSTIDIQMTDGLKNMPIEKRAADEVKYITGKDDKGKITKVLLTPPESPAVNYAFDVTPARLVSKLITEKGVCEPEMQAILEIMKK